MALKPAAVFLLVGIVITSDLALSRLQRPCTRYWCCSCNIPQHETSWSVGRTRTD
jgi:hypothetical protein